ncbi:FlgO family outer membrane protein [Alteromonas facilis]|uniref:FlgO family outer membrane protein n=1 Tax=Alteromonas facilis TaxID=2048004 RepID=UPI001F0C9DFC|nr:FlgO family outer membrane protein [Alteromonas facilis]
MTLICKQSGSKMYGRFYLGSALLACMLSGCAMFGNEQTATVVSQIQDTPANMQVIDITGAQPQDNDMFVQDAEDDNDGAFKQPQVYSSVQGAYKGRPLDKNIGDYVKNMAQDMIGNMQYVSTKTPVAVTHFALLDSNLEETNLLGHQMAESFVHELHNFRIPVIDYKATDYVRVTEHGDFILTRNYLELRNELPMDYVLTGTLTKHQGGYLVNARILALQSKAVVASAQTLIPFYVVDALIPSERQSEEMHDGVKLSRG